MMFYFHNTSYKISMRKKIIYLFLRKHFEQKDWESNGCQILLNNGFDIEIWSIVNWTFRNIEDPPHIFKKRTVLYLNTKEDFENELKRLNYKITMFLIYPMIGEDFGEASQTVRKIIKKNKFTYSDYCFSAVPHKMNINKMLPKNIIDIFLYYAKLLLLSKDNNYDNRHVEFEKLLFSLCYPSKYNFILCKAKLFQCANKFDIFRKKTILTHVFDYDKFLSRKHRPLSDPSLIKGQYIAFIDEFMFGHTDFKKNNSRSPIARNSEKYFYEINRMLSKLEDFYKCEVVIAAYPKADYQDNSIFNGRKMIYGETDCLVRDSKFSVLYRSTTINYIILYHKPFLMYYDDLVKTNIEWVNYARPLHHELKAKVFNISKLDDSFNPEYYMNHYDKNKYMYYKDKYICSQNTKNDYLFQIIADQLREKS